VRLPETPIYLDALLADQPLTGGLEPRRGPHHLRTLTIIGFPASTFPRILDELNRLAFPYRWSTRAIMLDKTDVTKLLTKIRRQWFAKRKSIALQHLAMWSIQRRTHRNYRLLPLPPRQRSHDPLLCLRYR